MTWFAEAVCSMSYLVEPKIRVPIWSNEGLAEYLSSNWDTKADMILRDIAVHERMPSVNELNYFMAYKGGQSLLEIYRRKIWKRKDRRCFSINEADPKC